MTGQSWFGAVGWRHIVAILACVFAIIPVLFVTSAALNPAGTLSSTSLIPKDFGISNFENLFNKTAFANWFFNSVLISGVATVAGAHDGDVRRVRLLAVPVQRDDGPACCSC